jgi:hypothetical protein
MSNAELPEVMIHMQVAPAHPFIVPHEAEHGMGVALEIPWSTAEPIEQNQQLGAISFEVDWRGTPDELIGFGACLDPVRPVKRRIEGNPSN